jgi:putative tryptophan/tyrosine transport system substrate-binding protein
MHWSSRLVAAFVAVLPIAVGMASQAAHAYESFCAAPLKTRIRILVISGRVEGTEQQIAGLKRALAAKGLAHIETELRVVDENIPERIAPQLDRGDLERSLAIVTLSGHIARSLVSLNLSKPVVFVTIADPLSWGIVDNLGPRQNNVTGVTYVVDLEWKPLELLRLAFPRARRIGLLADSYFFERAAVKDVFEHANARLGLTLVPFVAETREELERALASAAAQTVDAWIVPETPVVFRHEERVIELVSRRTVPTVFAHPKSLEKGAVMTFGVEFQDMWTEVGQMVGLICAGVEARNIPVVRPHRVFLGVSATNAKLRKLDIDPKIYRVATFTH